MALNRRTYIYSGDLRRMVDKETGEPMVPDGAPLAAPRTFGDIDDYVSPASRKVVSGRRGRREDMLRHNCIDANEISGAPTGLRNEDFARRKGLQHLLD